MPKLALPLIGLWAVVTSHLVYSARAEIAAPPASTAAGQAGTEAAAGPASATARDENPAAENENGDAYPVPPPPFTQGVFPCSDCHAELKTNPVRRELTEEHTEIKLRHDEKNRWCLDCHNADNRDYLHLASGKLVDFNQSYLLCGQCHGPTLADWKVGVHGKRTGMWNGKKQYLLCAHCHNPHSPRVNCS